VQARCGDFVAERQKVTRQLFQSVEPVAGRRQKAERRQPLQLVSANFADPVLQPVTRIDWGGRLIEAETRGKVLTARAAIVTAGWSVNVLASSTRSEPSCWSAAWPFGRDNASCASSYHAY
jgi:hypothetical protein